MKKLSTTQQKALDKLTDSWQSVYDLKGNRITLDSLVHKGYAERRRPLGALAFPSTIEYRRTREPANPG